MGKVIITRQKNRLLVTLFDEKKPILMETAPLPADEGILGNIYLAYVQDVVKSIHGAFLSIADKQTVYLPLSEKVSYLCANRSIETGELPRQGDELVVQITGEALKTKQPTASGDLTMTGQYVVCNFMGHGIVFSKKLDPEKKSELETLIKNAELPGRKNYRFTIRTNAGNLSDVNPLLEEIKHFIQVFDELKECYKYRKVNSCLYKSDQEIVKVIKNFPLSSYEEIVTDDETVYKLLKDSEKTVRFYKDEMISLSKLYSIETHLEEALSKKVWLPCGGYLIIEPTEAMVVIDVNSGKTDPRDKKNTDYFLKVNLEAAKEIARQLRLRNYSGMIMVDFINMENKSHKEKLIKDFDLFLKEDRIPTRLIDMTALGIVEITRKKINKPLADFF